MAGGRPTDYREEYNDQVYKFCLLGLTDAEIAPLFDVTEVTLNNWKKEFPEFFKSMREGREIADANVAKSLYERANGYSHEEEKVFCVEGEIVTHTVMKHYPPDTAAASRWLGNRRRDKWAEQIDVNLKGNLAEGLAAAMARINEKSAD